MQKLRSSEARVAYGTSRRRDRLGFSNLVGLEHRSVRCGEATGEDSEGKGYLGLVYEGEGGWWIAARNRGREKKKKTISRKDPGFGC